MSRTKKPAPSRAVNLPEGKRRLEEDQTQATTNKRSASHSDERPSKKRKPSKTDAAPTTTSATTRPEQTAYDATISSLTPDALAQKFTDAIKKHRGADISTIELDDQSVPASCLRDTTSFTLPRVVTNLAAFLEQFADGGKDALSSSSNSCAGSPHTLLITSSAIRATDLIRAVRDFGSDHSKIAKLFAKHMKIAEMRAYVARTRFGIGAGTGKRVADLLQDDGGGALKIDGLKRIVVDASYVNEKQNTIFEDREGFLQVVGLLNVEGMKVRLVRGETEVLVF